MSVLNQTSTKFSTVESTPARVEVLRQLERILNHEHYKSSDRRRRFLEFIVNNALQGDTERLKGFTIAIEVFGRDEFFDPQTDPIVRIEAGRLRDDLERYYRGPGTQDSIEFSIPRGGNVPAFAWRLPPADTALPVQTPEQPGTGKPLGRLSLAIFLGGGIVAAALIAYILIDSNRQQIPASPATFSEILTPPFIAVMPFTTLTQASSEERLAAGLVEAVITDLTKLSGLMVMAHSSMLELNKGMTSIQTLKQDYGASHVLRGSLELEDDNVRINVQLIDTSTLATIWADRLDGPVDNLFNLQVEMARRVVGSLAVEVLPAERSRIENRYTSNLEALAMYRQALLLIIPPDDMTRINTARQLFQRVRELDPGFAGGYAGEGFSHTITVLFLKAQDPRSELEQGIKLGKKAVEIDPEFGMGYATLSFAYALSGELELARSNANKAVEVQPGDAFAQFVLGLNLVLTGQPEKALNPLQEALRLDPAEPHTPYLNVLGITEFVRESYPSAADAFELSISRGGPTGPHMDIIRAITFYELGEIDKARALIGEVNRTNANYPVEAWLTKWLGHGKRLEKAMAAVNQLGWRHGG